MTIFLVFEIFILFILNVLSIFTIMTSQFQFILPSLFAYFLIRLPTNLYYLNKKYIDSNHSLILFTDLNLFHTFKSIILFFPIFGFGFGVSFATHTFASLAATVTPLTADATAATLPWRQIFRRAFTWCVHCANTFIC